MLGGAAGAPLLAGSVLVGGGAGAPDLGGIAPGLGGGFDIVI